MTSEKRGAGGDGEGASPTHVGDGPDDADSACPTPPGLETNIADRPEVKALLMEIRKGLKEGEDPLYYDWTDQDAPTPPSEAQVYVAGVALKPMRQQTMDLEKVRVAGHDPSRRAITARLPSRGSGSADAPPSPAEDRGGLTPSSNLSMPVTISSCDRAPVPNHKEGVSPSPSHVPKHRLVYPAAAAAIFVSLGFLLLLVMRQAPPTPTPTAAPRRTAAEVPTAAGPSPSPPTTTASVMPQPDAALTATVPALTVGPSAPGSKPGAAPEKPTPRPPPPGTTVPRWKKPSIKPAASSDAIERHPVF